MKKKLKHIITLSVLLIIGKQSYSQHYIEFNQHMVYQPLVNFASASSYSKVSAALFHRNQWVGMNGAPVSSAVSVVLPINTMSSRVGLSVLKDEIGISSNYEISIGYSYSSRLNKKSSLAFSLSPTLRMNSDEFKRLTLTDNQDGLLSQNFSYQYIDFKFGTYYYGDQFYIGFSTPNLLTVNSLNNEGGQKIDYKLKFSRLNLFLNAGTRFKLDSKNELLVSSFLKDVGGAPLHIEVNSLWEYDQKFGIGVGYRSTKDIVGITRFKITKELLLSYAFQYGSFSKHDNRGASHEIMLVFQLGKEISRYKYFTPRF